MKDDKNNEEGKVWFDATEEAPADIEMPEEKVEDEEEAPEEVTAEG